MKLIDRLQAVTTAATRTARGIGLPVEPIERFNDERLEPLVIKYLAPYAIPFVRRSRVRVEVLEAGIVVCRVPLKGNVNHIGTMYAGALFTLAEFPVGPLMLATFGMRRFVPIVLSLELEFVKAAKSDVTVTFTMPPERAGAIEAETLDKGESAFQLEGELKDAQGAIVARSTAGYLMRGRRS